MLSATMIIRGGFVRDVGSVDSVVSDGRGQKTNDKALA